MGMVAAETAYIHTCINTSTYIIIVIIIIIIIIIIVITGIIIIILIPGVTYHFTVSCIAEIKVSHHSIQQLQTHKLVPDTVIPFPLLTQHSSFLMRQGSIRESPPSLMSKPLDIPSIEEEEWNMGEILDKVPTHARVQTL